MLIYVPKMHTTWSNKMKHSIILSETAAFWYLCIKISFKNLCVFEIFKIRRFYTSGGLKFKFAAATTHIRVHLKQYSIISCFVTETNIPFAEINWNPDYLVFNTNSVPIVLTCHPLSTPSPSRNVICRTPQFLCPPTF